MRRGEKRGQERTGQDRTGPWAEKHLGAQLVPSILRSPEIGDGAGLGQIPQGMVTVVTVAMGWSWWLGDGAGLV